MRIVSAWQHAEILRAGPCGSRVRRVHGDDGHHSDRAAVASSISGWKGSFYGDLHVHAPTASILYRKKWSHPLVSQLFSWTVSVVWAIPCCSV